MWFRVATAGHHAVYIGQYAGWLFLIDYIVHRSLEVCVTVGEA